MSEWYPTKGQRKRKAPLFQLADGTDVFYGDILHHPDRGRVGWACTAEFSSDGDWVTVRSIGGAVPTVLISELMLEPPVEKRCNSCGQLLPNK